MKIMRIDITAWTASFRYPNLISGVQPTLEVPPISTILGLINAATGKYIRHNNMELGYYFEYGAKAEDIETTYQITSDGKGNPTNEGKSNVMLRHFLFDVKLSLYLTDYELIRAFKQPVYPLLLGRSGDLASVVSIQEVNLEEIPHADKIKGQVIPVDGFILPGKIQALPRYFTDTFPRKNLGTEAFSIVRFDVPDFKTKCPAWRDVTQGKSGVDIFIHHINIDDYE